MSEVFVANLEDHLVGQGPIIAAQQIVQEASEIGLERNRIAVDQVAGGNDERRFQQIDFPNELGEPSGISPLPSA